MVGDMTLMMAFTLTPEWFNALIVPGVLAFAWLIRLEGRQSAHEKVCEHRQKILDERHTEVRDEMKRMNAKLDVMISGRRAIGEHR